jgi:hypothetical protein
LEVASIGLTDGTGTTLAAGRLGLNSSGDVVVHDNASNAEDLPYLVDSRESLNFSTRVLAAAMNNVTFSRKLADIYLPASALTDGKQLLIHGRTFALWTAGAIPNDVIVLVLCKEGEPPTEDGYFLTFAEGVTSEDRSFSLAFSFSVAATTWTLSRQSTIAACIVRKNNAGTITHAAAWDAGDSGNQGPITGPVGEPVKFELHLVTLDASDTVVANLFASGQLSIIHE